MAGSARPDLVRDMFDETPAVGFSRKLVLSGADPQWDWRPAARNHDPDPSIPQNPS
jgi:hypothetical protein